jgi:signal transduction histidine kinase
MICVVKRFPQRGISYYRWLRKAVTVVGALLLVVGSPYTFVGASQDSAAQSTYTYRTVASILALSPDKAAHGYPAQLRGIVTKPTEQGLFMQDQTAGIWVKWDAPENLSAGDRVEVDGVVRPGLFSPVVRGLAVRKLGKGSLPTPVAVTLKQLLTGDWECQYVSVTGIVRSAGLRPRVADSEKLWLRIALKDGSIDAALPKQDAAAANSLIDAVVRIDAVATSTKNEKRQLTAPVLSVSSIRNLKVLKPGPADMFSQPLTPIGRLIQYRSGTDYDHRVRVVGTVTYYKSGDRLILEDAGSAVLVMAAQTGDIKPGDKVEAVGFVAPNDSGPVLQDAMLRYVAPGLPLVPRPAGVQAVMSGSLNNNLVSIEGRLVRRLLEPSREVLLLQSGSALLVAELRDSNNSNALQYLRDGSTIRVSGVSILEVEGEWHMGGTDAGAISSIILLRSRLDVQVIRLPSWWTTPHVVYVAVAFVLTFLGLIVYSRMEHWRLQAVLEERERLANDMHDTLAQSFAGIGFQLQAIRKAIPSGSPQLRQQVDLARTLVRHSHKEARRSLEPLNPDLAEADLMMSLVASAKQMVEGCSVEVKTVTAGTPTPLPLPIATCLLRIGQEAVANAVRHADPSRLDISISYEKHSVRLSIHDNGRGFMKSGDLLGFGLRGMRKRAAAISGRLEIASQPGEGTRIEVTAPLPPNLTATIFFKRVWKQLSESTSNVDAKND